MVKLFLVWGGGRSRGGVGSGGVGRSSQTIYIKKSPRD